MGDHQGKQTVRDKTLVERWRTPLGKAFKFVCHVPDIPVREGNARKAYIFKYNIQHKIESFT